jgi:hypothetical protein
MTDLFGESVVSDEVPDDETRLTLPQVQEEMEALARMLDLCAEQIALDLERSAKICRHVAAQLVHLARVEIPRRKGARRTPVKSRRLTPELKRQIRMLKAANPDLSHQEVSHRAGTNPGRVTDSTIGRRKGRPRR